MFAEKGKVALVIDSLSTLVGKSRSSFYHNFKGMEKFEDELFRYHYRQGKDFRTATKSIKNMIPEYVEASVAYKDWVFFQKQLYLIRFEHNRYMMVYDRVRKISETKTTQLWLKTVGLEQVPIQTVEKFYSVIRSTLFTRIDYYNFTYNILKNEVERINESFGFLLDNQLDKTG